MSATFSAFPLYADVLLPVALPAPLTYGCPAEWKETLQVGCRVAVSFRKSQMLVGVVVRIHREAPEGYAVKPLLEVLDATPVMQPWQWDFWQEMARYYLCTPGEVLQAAMPSGLLPEGRTVFQPHPEAPEDLNTLSETEYEVYEFLQAQGSATHDEMKKHFPGPRLMKALRRLVGENHILARQELERQWKPRRVRYIGLNAGLADEEKLRAVFDSLRRAPRQETALLTYLKVAGYTGNKPLDVPFNLLTSEDPTLQPALAALVKKGILVITEQTGRYQQREEGAAPGSPALTPAQHAALEEILAAGDTGKPALLFGATASGKTEIYIQRLLQLFKEDPKAQALLLVPEIALTTQLIERLRAYLGDRVAVFHSRFGENNRTEVWLDVLHNRCFRLITGARSALLLPFARLKLIIVDEEHEPSFRQDDPAPRYHARDFAVALAHRLNIPVVLGSATPSSESYHNAQTGKYSLVRLKERYGGAEPPRKVVVNMAAERAARRLEGVISQPLKAEMESCLAQGRQVILFQNRKGFAPVLQCVFCGYVPQCRHCDISLTLYQKPPSMKCRYCGYTEPPLQRCPACGHPDLLRLGFGTEKVEDEVARLFPDVVCDRLDADTARSVSAYRRILERFDAGDSRILIGTQMVTKGLDFARVGLVGILSADSLLALPDFRAGERTYQLLVQASGRAGRRQWPGVVVVQTYRPDHPVLKRFMNEDTETFLKEELEERRRFGYPPFVRLIRVTFSARDRSMALRAAEAVKESLTSRLQARVLGPEPPPVGRVRDAYLYDLNVKVEPNKARLARVKEHLWQCVYEPPLSKKFPGVRVVFRVDV